MPPIDLSRYPKKKKSNKTGLNSGNGFFDFLTTEISFGNAQFPDKKKESFYVELSTLLLSGIDIKTALELLLVGQEKIADKDLFTEIKEHVLTGKSLSEALQLSGKFSNYEFFSVKIGEEAGKLGEVLTDLASYFKQKINQRRKIINAVTYPVIVLSTSLGAVFFMIKFVVPMFADVFLRFGGELPWITQKILSFSKWFDKYFAFTVLVLLILGVSIYLCRMKVAFRKNSANLILRLPVIGDLVRKIYLARFANSMRLLISTDIPLLRAIGLVRQMIDYYPIETSLLEIEDKILQGAPLHESLAAYNLYPAKMVQLVKVGEEVNRMDEFFEKIAVQYTEEVEYKSNTISTMLEPLIIIFLGLVVGIILIAMYLPMFQLSNSF